MYCPKCGAEISNDSLLCNICGYNMSEKKQTKRDVNAAFNYWPRRSSEEYHYNYYVNDDNKTTKHGGKKPLAVILLIIAFLFAACSAFAFLTGFGVIDNYLGFFETTTEKIVENTEENLSETEPLKYILIPHYPNQKKQTYTIQVIRNKIPPAAKPQAAQKLLTQTHF